jgi:hypothetical protein
LIFIVGISCLNNVEVGFILISLILAANLFLTIFTLPYLKKIYSILKILSDLALFIFMVIMTLIFKKYQVIIKLDI